MINFLPEKLKKEVKKEYSLRVFTVFLVSSFLVMVFVLVFLTPAFILAIARKDSITQQLDMIKGSSLNQTNDTLNSVKITNEIVKVLSLGTESNKTVSGFIKSAVEAKGSGIKISGISTEYDSTQTLKMTLKGFSSTRDGLTKYVKDLKNLNLFSSVDLPVSSLVKSSDMDFVISLVVKKE